MRVFKKGLMVLALAFAPLTAFAQCAGFTDTANDGFCNNIEWIKNRSVTLGCTVTTYCPFDFVNRTQMAAFLNRLGDALAPIIQRTTDTAFNGTYDPLAVGCISAPVALIDTPTVKRGFPHQATFMATLMNYSASATKTIQGQLVFSTNGGTNWTPTGDLVMWQTIDPQERTTLALVGGPLPLDAGLTYQFAIQTVTNDPIATVFGECQLNVRIESRTGTSTPF